MPAKTKSVDIGGGNRAFSASGATLIKDPNYKPGQTCVFCGNSFDNPKNSTRRHTIIWVRKLVRTGGSFFRVHGSVDATCNDRLDEFAVAQLVWQ